MSMLSAQCDELRQMAESVGLEVPQAATLMMEAADVIWELRDDLQRANDAVRDAEHDESMAWDRVRKAEAENAKLRELCADMFKTIQVTDEDWHSLTDFTTMAEAAETYDFDVENAPEYEEKLHELGVEVDG